MFEARLEIARVAFHDWLSIASSMNLSRFTCRTGTHDGIWHRLQRRECGLAIVSEAGRLVFEKTLY